MKLLICTGRTVILSTALFLLSSSGTISQTVAGYSFENYPSTASTSRKAPINFSSNPNAKGFRTRITEGYKYGKINFAGHYVAIFIGCGTGCRFGVLVDANTGKIYNIPSNVDDYGIGTINCPDYYEVDNPMFKNNSRLFIAMYCETSGDEQNVKNNMTFFIWLWNESKKKFEKLKDIKRTLKASQ